MDEAETGPEFSTGWRPGLVGEIARAHAIYYAREWRFGAFFETKVARELASFVDRYDPARDLLLSAWAGDRFLGSIVIDGSDPDLATGEAHLRWFITADAARGQGAGGRLLAAAMAFLAERGFARCYLTTFAGLDAARRLYEQAGFTLTAAVEAESWGQTVLEQRFDLVL